MDATEIVDGLFQGGELWPAMPRGFDAVMGLRWEAEDYAVPLATIPGLRVFAWVPMVDGPTLPDVDVLAMLLDTLELWRELDWKCLIHCAEGHNRSGLVVGCFLKRQGYGGQEAIDLIREKRPGALSNETFVRAILEW